MRAPVWAARLHGIVGNLDGILLSSLNLSGFQVRWVTACRPERQQCGNDPPVALKMPAR